MADFQDRKEIPNYCVNPDPQFEKVLRGNE